MQTIQYNQAGTIAVYLPARVDASPTATVYTPEGAVSESSVTVTRDTVDTTCSASVALGAQSVTVTSATGVTVGRRYLLGGAESDGGEQVTVKSVTGTTVTLVRPVILARASGVAFQGNRVTLPIAAKTTCGRGYRADIAYAISTVAQPGWIVPFAVTRYAMTSACTVESVRTLDPNLTKRLPAGLWWPDIVATAWDILQSRISQLTEPGSMVGTLDLTIAHGYLVRELLAEIAGDDFEKARELFATRCKQEYEAVMAASKFDADQDGVPDKSARWGRHITMVRS